MVKGEGFVGEDGGSNPSIELFFLNFSFISFAFRLILSSSCINFLFENLAKCLLYFVYALEMLLIIGFAL